jgi:hypothetical protein
VRCSPNGARDESETPGFFEEFGDFWVMGILYFFIEE